MLGHQRILPPRGQRGGICIGVTNLPPQHFAQVFKNFWSLSGHNFAYGGDYNRIVMRDRKRRIWCRGKIKTVFNNFIQASRCNNHFEIGAKWCKVTLFCLIFRGTNALVACPFNQNSRAVRRPMLMAVSIIATNLSMIYNSKEWWRGIGESTAIKLYMHCKCVVHGGNRIVCCCVTRQWRTQDFRKGVGRCPSPEIFLGRLCKIAHFDASIK